MTLWQAVWYILAIVLLILAAANIKARRVSLALLGAAFALLAYAWPGLAFALLAYAWPGLAALT